jgi:hypothetical protein
MDSPKYPWQQFVIDAYLEFNPQLLPGKINVAERAISQRFCEDSIDPEEHVALQDALIALRVLLPRKERAEGDGEKENIA